jgi:hypothetical protein
MKRQTIYIIVIDTCSLWLKAELSGSYYFISYYRREGLAKSYPEQAKKEIGKIGQESEEE